MPIEPGYWYDVEENPQYIWINQIKLIPSERWLETQDPRAEYFEVIGRGEDLKEISIMTGSHLKKECLQFIEDNFKIRKYYQTLTDELYQLKQELSQDYAILRKGVNKKDKEIALHLIYTIRMLDTLEDYENKGLGDIEY